MPGKLPTATSTSASAADRRAEEESDSVRTPAPARTPAEEDAAAPAPDEVEAGLTDGDMYLADTTARILSAVLLGLPSGAEEWDALVLSAGVAAERDASVTSAVAAAYARGITAGVFPSDEDSTTDSALAAYFTHCTTRCARLARHSAMQVEFLGHFLLTAAALYSFAPRPIEQLYPDQVYDLAYTALVLLDRMRLSLSNPLSGDAAADGGVRQRKGAPKGSIADVAAALSALPEDVAAATSYPPTDGLRKVCLTFLASSQHVIRSVELRARGLGTLSPEELERMSLQKSIASLLSSADAAPTLAVYDSMPTAERDVMRARVKQLGSTIGFVACMSATVFLWMPLLFSSLPPAMAPILSNPTVRSGSSAVLIAAAIVCVYYLWTTAAPSRLPPTAARLFSFLRTDGDVRALGAAEAGTTALAFSVFDEIAHVTGSRQPFTLPGMEAEAAAATAAQAAAVATKSQPGASGNVAADASTEAPDLDASVGAGAGSDMDEGEETGVREGDSVEFWSDALGVSHEEASEMLTSFRMAGELARGVVPSELADAVQTAPSSAAGEEAADAAGAAGARTDQARLRVTLPPNLFHLLQSLYFKLEEMGELSVAKEVAERVNFLNKLLVKPESETKHAEAEEEVADAAKAGTHDATAMAPAANDATNS